MPPPTHGSVRAGRRQRRPHLNHLRAIELTSGEYFKWFAHDDLIAPTFLERCVEALDNHPSAVLAASRIQVIDDAGTLLGETDPPPRIEEPQPHLRLRSFWRQPPVHQTMYGVIRRSALEQTHLMGDWFAAERALFLELTLQGGFERVDEPLASHRSDKSVRLQGEQGSVVGTGARGGP